MLGLVLAMNSGACVPVERDNPADPLAPGTSSNRVRELLIDDGEDQDRLTLQGPDFAWEARTDRQILLRGNSSVSPTDDAIPYMAAPGYLSDYSFQATGTLRHDIFGGEVAPFFGFVRVDVGFWADPARHRSLSYVFHWDSIVVGFSPRLTVGLLAEDGDFFSWVIDLPQVGLPEGGTPFWETTTLKFSESKPDSINFHRSLVRPNLWDGPGRKRPP